MSQGGCNLPHAKLCRPRSGRQDDFGTILPDWALVFFSPSTAHREGHRHLGPVLLHLDNAEATSLLRETVADFRECPDSLSSGRVGVVNTFYHEVKNRAKLPLQAMMLGAHPLGWDAQLGGDVRYSLLLNRTQVQYLEAGGGNPAGEFFQSRVNQRLSVPPLGDSSRVDLETGKIVDPTSQVRRGMSSTFAK